MAHTCLFMSLSAILLIGAASGCSSPAAAPESDRDEDAAIRISAGEEGTQTVTLYRDAWGVPHVVADSLQDAAFGLGYAQAEDRIDDLYRNIRIAVGTLAELEGPERVDQDYIMRLVRNAVLSQEYWETAPDPIRLMGDNYIRGVQAYLDRHPDAEPDMAFPLEGWHVMAVGRAMILRWPIGTVMGDLERRHDDPGFGSNGWAVAPERSADGSAMLLIDPHLTWDSLQMFYEARVYTPEHQLSGFYLVGSPLMALGHNAHVAWSCTTGGPDTSDVYEMRLNPANPLQYEYDGEWRMARIESFSIPVKGDEPVQRPAFYTHLGPVIAEPDLENHRAYVGASPYFEQTGLAEQMYRMLTARSAAEFYDALAMNEFMEQNILFADAEGVIQYVRTGAVPIRPEGYDWRAPVPGHTSETAWLGIHPIEDLVQVKNPPQGYFQNCNISPAMMMADSPMTPDRYPDYIFNVSWDHMNPRGQRALELLDGNAAVTRDDAQAISFDVYEIQRDLWVDALTSAVAASTNDMRDDPDLQQAIERIIEWDGEYVPESAGALLFAAWRMEHHDAPLDNGDHVLRSLAQALRTLRDRYGADDLTWGDVYRVGRGGRFFPAPGAHYGSGPSRGQTLFSVRGEEQPDGMFVANNGSMATQLVFFHPETGVESYSCTPWGQSADPESPHYLDQAERLYSTRTFKSSWNDVEELPGLAQSKTVLDIPK